MGSERRSFSKEYKMVGSLQYQKAAYQPWVSTPSTGSDTGFKDNYEL